MTTRTVHTLMTTVCRTALALFFLLSLGIVATAHLASAGSSEKAQEFMAAGKSYEERGLWGPAIAAYERALKEDPRIAEAYYRIGAISAQLGNNELAAENYRMAVSIQPGHAGAVYR